MAYTPKALASTYSIRRMNLEKIVLHLGGIALTSRLLGPQSSPSYLCQIAHVSKHRRSLSISERTARILEENLNLPPGLLDRPLTFAQIAKHCPRTE